MPKNKFSFIHIFRHGINNIANIPKKSRNAKFCNFLNISYKEIYLYL